MNAAEDEALLRGCKHAFLDTFSFQAAVFIISSAMGSLVGLRSSAANVNGITCKKGSMTGSSSTCLGAALKAHATFRSVG